ncbi:CEG1A-like protein [Mya arenaria]|uniref:CEG1A-like protein n=1 Tax=Mya arenaria TaxID=6604 RepID=A0ABY7E6M8_MYAAR|nr:CEG1A-like protein [Mya arenaria]
MTPLKMFTTLKRMSLPYRRSKSDSQYFGGKRSNSFVNSQEWTLSRSVPDLKLGILGHVQSGKSALVHRYLTGSYMQEESPEGGRFKKEVIIDGQSYLLLIRDEGGIPEMQFTQWVDAVIFVFSLENEVSFQSVYQYYLKMTHFRNTAEIPLILVGTQDAISESNPRVIDDTRARKLANDLKRCSYYETCATYGLNVERVFQDACSRIVQFRYPSMPSALPNVPSTPNHSQRPFYASQSSKPYDTHSNSSQSTSSSGTLITRHEPGTIATDDVDSYPQSTPLSSRKSSKKQSNVVQKSNSFSGAATIRQYTQSQTTPVLSRKNSKFLKSSFLSDKMERYMMELQVHENVPVTPNLSNRSSRDKPDPKDLPTPTSTPTQSRKNRRRSNLFNVR